MKQFSLNLIPGDGIGVDVIREGRRVLDRIAEVGGGISFRYNELPWSCEYYLKNGKMSFFVFVAESEPSHNFTEPMKLWNGSVSFLYLGNMAQRTLTFFDRLPIIKG